MPSIPAGTLIDMNSQSLPLYTERERGGGEGENELMTLFELQDPVMVKSSLPFGYPTFVSQ